MARIHHGWLVAALALGLVTACKKDGKTSESGGDTSSESGGKGGAKAADDLSLLPVDSELVLGVNFAQVQASSLWKQFVEPKMMDADTQAKLKKFKDTCGMDPTSSIKSLSVGMKGLGGTPSGVIVLHGVDKAKTWACLEKPEVKADMNKEGGEFVRDGEVGLAKQNGTAKFGMTFVNDTTAVAVLGESVDAAAVKAAAAGGSALKTSATFVEMYGKVKSSDSVWFLMNGKSPLFEKAGAMGVKPQAVFGSVNVTDGLSLDMRMRVDTADSATQLVTAGNTQIKSGPVATMFDKLELTNDGADIHLVVGLSPQKLQDLVKQFGGMLGMMAGGMGQ